MATKFMRWYQPSVVGTTPTIKNHTATLVDNELYVFGGYDGRRNHSTVHILDCTTFSWRTSTQITGKFPAGRNGHTATLADRKIFIIGGWLGSGPLAASDMHYLDIDKKEWVEPPVVGKPPGPCNMHTADFVEHRRQIFVFRGGDGREYLNDLHGLDIDTCRWEEVVTKGEAPQARANHSSAVAGDHLFIFGGWNGQTRLNDVHVLNTETLVWTIPQVKGPLPHPRAGMTFTRLRNRVYLFGGSGPSAKCFNDLQIFDPEEMAWIETVPSSSSLPRNSEGSGECSTSPAMVSTDDMLVPHQPNPNDEHMKEQVVIIGDGPGHRAGHTATVVNRQLFVFGGSYGSDYLCDFFVLDTDPTPEARISSPSCLQLLSGGLRNYVNAPEFADVTFVVEGRTIYGHKIVLSLLSDRFRALFSSGFRESSQREIVITDWSYSVFLLMIEYLYTGREPEILSHSTASTNSLDLPVELLELADQYMLDHLKQLCEARLQAAVRDETVEFLLQLAERTNAWQLGAVCRHYIRNHTSASL